MRSLNTLRKEIDVCDLQLVAILQQRFVLTAEVGQWKAAHHMPAVSLEREKAQMKRIAALAEEKGLDPEMMQAILRIIIDRVVTNHREICGDMP